MGARLCSQSQLEGVQAQLKWQRHWHLQFHRECGVCFPPVLRGAASSRAALEAACRLRTRSQNAPVLHIAPALALLPATRTAQP